MKKIFWTEDELQELYHEGLRDIYGTVKICGAEFDAADVYREMDHHGYRGGFLDWMDAEGINEGKDNEGNFTYIWDEQND